ncbi:MAG TPA: diguanylate cyclase [Thermotogota bacterium]|nr:diguanylate cyclase [Thermotogota bacterium]HRW35329.1 diguanylate cyclase [Thermotogota bacterium]
MIDYSLEVMLLCIATAFMLYILYRVITIKDKYPLHWMFIGLIASTVIMHLGSIVECYTGNILLKYTGVLFIPPFVLLTGFTFSHIENRLSRYTWLLFVIPVISLIILSTNHYHHLFYQVYTLKQQGIIIGNYFYIHTIYSYACIIIGMLYLMMFSMRNKGLFSTQALLIILAVSIGAGLNVIQVLKLWDISVFYTPLTFSIPLVFIYIAIVKYDFLDIVPLALRKVLDLISDGLIILSKHNEIIDYNKTLELMMPNACFNRRQSFFSYTQNLNFEPNEYQSIRTDLENNHQKATIDKTIRLEDAQKFFRFEFIPLFIHDSHYAGTVVIMKDITESQNYITLIEEKSKLQEKLANMDELTGINNRRRLFEFAKIEWNKMKQMRQTLSVLMIDIDHFKAFNDNYGHDIGDKILKLVAETISKTIRNKDTVGRYGGEEFVVLLPETDGSNAYQTAQRIRKLIKEKILLAGRLEGLSCTVSIGVSTYSGQEKTFEDLLNIADKKLYLAKENGRNRVEQ